MDWSKVKFTRLQDRIMDFLFKNPTTSFMGKEIADKLKVSKTAVSKAIDNLVKSRLVVVEKRVILSIKLNRENKELFELKRIYNLRNIYSNKLVEKLSADFPGSSLVLFGSYSFGDDTEESDIDLAIIGYGPKKLELSKFENNFQRKIQLHFFNDFKKIDKNLKESIINGIVLKGAIQL